MDEVIYLVFTRGVMMFVAVHNSYGC